MQINSPQSSEVGHRSPWISVCGVDLLPTGSSLEERGCDTGKSNQIKCSSIISSKFVQLSNVARPVLGSVVSSCSHPQFQANADRLSLGSCLFWNVHTWSHTVCGLLSGFVRWTEKFPRFIHCCITHLLSRHILCFCPKEVLCADGNDFHRDGPSDPETNKSISQALTVNTRRGFSFATSCGLPTHSTREAPVVLVYGK